MQKRILALMIMLFSIGAVLAQSQPVDEAFPLLVSGVLGEDSHQYALYRYTDGELEPLPIEDFYAGSLSPDGSWFAYQRLPPFLKDLLKTQGHQYGTAWDITLLNLRDGSERVVAVQPETTAATENSYQGGIKRSLPVWSPDSRALAWIEQDYPAQNAARVLVYDLESQETHTLEAELPQMPNSSDGMPNHLSWGVPGIAVLTAYENSGMEMGLRLYDPEEGLRYLVRLPSTDSGEYGLHGPLWMGETPFETESDLVVVQAFDAQWYQVNSAGEAMPLETNLKMLSATKPTESLRLVWKIYSPEDDGPGYLAEVGGNPLVLMDENSPLKEGTMGLPVFVFAPSGQAAAYISEGILFVWQDENLTEMALPEGLRINALYWGPSRWQPGPETSRQTGDGVGG